MTNATHATHVDSTLFRFATAGSVDDGKSTLVGRLLHDSKAILADQLESVARTSAERGFGGEPGAIDFALLTLRPQAVGQQRQVGGVKAALAADPLDRVELVREDRLGVVEQAADERRLAVVDRAGGREPQQVVAARLAGDVRGRCRGGGVVGRRHQKYPCFLRSSMAASERRSSARVAPRSVSREAASSRITPATSPAAESTAPVQLMSPTVR